MKILTFVYSLGIGGTERTAQNFATGYAAEGCESSVVYAIKDGPRRQELTARGISVRPLHSAATSAFLSRWRPDVVHVHSHGITAEDYNVLARDTLHAKIIETNVFSKPSPWAALLHSSYQLSEWCKLLFDQRANNKYPSAVVPNPVDTSAFYPSHITEQNAFRAHYDLNPDDFIMGRVGQPYAGKWSPRLVPIFECIRNKNSKARLMLVNSPPSLISQAKNSHYYNDIRIIKSLRSDTELRTCYSSMDLFVLIAEQGESFGMVAAESLLCETPVVTLATPWADNSQGEVVGNGVGGYVATSVKMIPELIQELIAAPAKRATLGKCGRERIIQRYSIKEVTKKSLEIIGSPKKIHPSSTSFLQEMENTRGRIDPLSKVLLWLGKKPSLLRYTTGHQRPNIASLLQRKHRPNE